MVVGNECMALNAEDSEQCSGTVLSSHAYHLPLTSLDTRG